ncbi:drug/metabolite exporter YedA [Luteimonas sp. RD2P54]|uniref:Drug/metabolite exporter YedA n=1 Tax=Luteimonas endophytica TaxID=3042023 RepID=A0ABT6JD10_9GAMM|nr:drug/metabolite exporter YedA [Luteimonas endophytica]MDH5824703.1 drug/metabolite exporter YedA [Luteimonas endophytica]
MSAAPSLVSRPATALAVAGALALVYVIWGSTYLGIRFALEGGFPPLLMAGLRFVAAGTLMYTALRLRGLPAPSAAQWRNCTIMGVLLLGGGNGLVCIAEQTVSSGMAAIAVASAPLWIGLFVTLRGQRPGRLEWTGLAIGFVGVLWLNAGSSLTATPVGLVALLVAPVAWAFGSVWSRGRDLPSPFMTAAAQMLCGGGAMLLLGPLLGERFAAMPTLHGTLWVLYLIGFGSIVAFTAYVWLLHHVRPTLAGSYAYVNPVIAVVLGAWLAGERFTAHDIGAMAVILCGVVAITLARTRPPRPAAPEPDPAA